MGVGAWLDIDLLRQRREDYGQVRPQVVSTRSLLRRGALIGIALPAGLLLICGWLFLRNHWLAAEARSLASAEQEYGDLQQRLQTARSDLKQLDDQNREVAKALADVRSSSAFLTELQRRIPTRLQLDSVVVQGQGLALRGEGDPKGGFKMVNAFLLSLKASTFLDPSSVKLVDAVFDEGQTLPRLRYQFKANFAPDAAEASAGRLQQLGAKGVALRIALMRGLGLLP